MTLQLIDQTWASQAACVAVDPEAFYPERSTKQAERRLIKAICRGCPVVSECLQDAMSRDEQWGIWGGLDPHERAVLAGRADTRGRLRRTHVA